jgi:hypothetical protein
MTTDNFKDLQRSNNYYTQIFNFQDNRPRPLAALDYYVLQQDYSVNCRLVSGYIHREIQHLLPLAKPIEEQGPPFNTAAFNVTHLHDDNYKNYVKTMEPILKGFLDYTGKILSIVAYTRDENFESMFESMDEYQQDALLLCYPGKFDKGGWEDSYPQEDRIIKSKFFAFLWNQGLITEEQLYSEGIMQDWNYRDIYEQKKTLDQRFLA